MSNNNNSTNIDLNEFLKSIKLKKQYIIKLNQKIHSLDRVKETNIKAFNFSLTSFNANNSRFLINDHLVMYIIDISFSQTNTLMHVMDHSANLKYFCSAGTFNYKGRSKKARFTVFKQFFQVLTKKLTFLEGKPIALHLKNVGSNKSWIIKKLKKKFYIKVIRSFNLFPHNGCRKKKVRRKKFKKRRNG